VGSCQASQIADMNGDGHGDVVAYAGRRMAVYAGDGAGHWLRAAAFRVPGNDYAAMRVADADHNGYPDIALVAKEGGSFNGRNHLRFYKEASSPSQQSAALVHPRGGETWIAGSVRFVEWTAAVPDGAVAEVRLELSVSGPAGPWSVVADSAPNSGRHQWLIAPDTPATSDAYMRLTLVSSAGETAVIGSAPFTIVAAQPG
jgi:hypothetical protein